MTFLFVTKENGLWLPRRRQTRISNWIKISLKASIVRHLRSTFWVQANRKPPEAWWKATAAAVNEQVYERPTRTQQTHFKKDTRAIHYLSAEFLMGRLTSNNLHNLSPAKICEEAWGEILRSELTDLSEQEPDMAPWQRAAGSSGLPVSSTPWPILNYLAVGYGIHYEHGLFRSGDPGWLLIERPDSWREYGKP